TPDISNDGTFYYFATATSATCGSVNSDIVQLTVTPETEITLQPSTIPETVCENDPTSTISVTAIGTGALSYQWFKNSAPSNSGGTLISGATSNSYNPPSDLSSVGTNYYYVEVSSSCGTIISSISGAITVNPIANISDLTVTVCDGSLFELEPIDGSDGIVPAGTTYSWAAPTVTGGITGGTSASGQNTISGTLFNPTSSQQTATYTVTPTSPAGSCAGPDFIVEVTVNPTPTIVDLNPFFSLCITSPTIPSPTPFTQEVSGVIYGIDQENIQGANGLPPGISASYNSTTKEIEFSGTATATGVYEYSIPLVGECTNGLVATGTIDVTPVYELTSVTSASATTIGGSASVTIFGDPTMLTDGRYEVGYQIKQGDGSFSTTQYSTFTVRNGKGTFSTVPINSTEDTYTVQIHSLEKTTGGCSVTFTERPTTYFGVCSAVFQTNSAGDFQTFYVPANVYSITIEVYGGGGAGNSSGGGGGGAYSIRRDIPVTPGEPIGLIVGIGGQSSGANGGSTYVTRDSSAPDQIGTSLVYANGGWSTGGGGTYDTRYDGEDGYDRPGNKGGDGGGPLGGEGGPNRRDGSSPGGGGGAWSGQKGKGGDGLVVISYSCPDADQTDCVTVIDDGSKSGYTVLEYTCDDTWVAPEGLAEFTVFVGSGGGGGGSGEGSGGGGSGAMIVQTFTTSNPYGLPAGTPFNIEVGDGGSGAVGINNPGSPGEASSFTGSIDGSPITIIVDGGGGGGSQNVNPGGEGASGGGGGATPAPNKSAGSGGTPIVITYSGTPDIIYNGNPGGNGDYNDPQNAIAGGGGGGLIPWKLPPANDGQNGKAAGAGQGEGGRGGDAITLTLGDSIRYFGAGGGGIGEYFNGTEKIGEGGSSLDEVKLGGDGNLDSPTAVGGKGKDKTGSGGGAGYGAGGHGGSGVVYIVYANVRILAVEYLYFDASFHDATRSGILTWATAKEWENSHFEIERSVNGIKNWEKIGEVAGAGYSMEPKEYKFTDEDLPGSGGVVYYRLKDVSFDQKSSYSNVQSIIVPAISGNNYWVAYPNPSDRHGEVNIDLINTSVYSDEPIFVRISDARGVTESFTVRSPEQVSQVVNQHLQSNLGLFIVQLNWGKYQQQLKIIRK
ncbi:glycine-rich domain-containing protein, partial [Algoriphagus limi]|nr:hypothetical protein [Algoriphagus limi]